MGVEGVLGNGEERRWPGKDSKEVALESLIKIFLPNFKNISCRCANPLKDSKDFKKFLLFILKNLVI